MPKIDPKLAALLKANPDRTPAEMYAVLYGQRRVDVELKPKGTLADLARKGYGKVNPWLEQVNGVMGKK